MNIQTIGFLILIISALIFIILIAVIGFKNDIGFFNGFLSDTAKKQFEDLNKQTPPKQVGFLYLSAVCLL